MKDKICFFGNFDWDYSRVITLKNALTKSDIDIIYCTFERNLHRHPKNLKTFFEKAFLIFYGWLVLYFQFVKIDKSDFNYLFVPHLNYFFIPIAYLIGKIYKKKIIFDSYDSSYLDTKYLHHSSKFKIMISYFIEYLAYLCSDVVFTLNAVYEKKLLEVFPILKKRKVYDIFASANESRFNPENCEKNNYENNYFYVLYWGNFLPVHGISTILNAANLLKSNENIKFWLVGSGPNYKEAKHMQSKLKLSNVIFFGKCSDSKLINLIHRSDICLGIFSNTPVSNLVITNKVFEALASGKAVITLDSPTTRFYFRSGVNILLVPPNNSDALKNEILRLYSDKKSLKNISKNGYSTFKKSFSEEVIGEKIWNILKG